MPQLDLVQSLNHDRDRMIADWSRSDLAAMALTKELRQLDVRLECIYVDPEAARLPAHLRGFGVVPGRWHVVRRNEGNVPDAWFPIMGPNMEYVEPTSKVVEDMRKADLWRPGALQELQRARVRAEIMRGREIALRAEQRIDVAAEAWRAAKRMPGMGGLYRNASRKGRKPRK